MNQLEKDILERLKKLRKDHSFSQLEVAQKLGFNSPIGYNKIEKGLTDLKIKHLIILSEFYHLPFEAFFSASLNTDTSNQNDTIHQLKIDNQLLKETLVNFNYLIKRLKLAKI